MQKQKTEVLYYWGVVEDINDPEQIGRVRVRFAGVHDERRDILPTDKLEWAIPLMPTISTSVNGIGYSPTGLKAGASVIGIFLDKENLQQPIILGSIAQISTKKDSKLGFTDPEGLLPRYEQESDTNRLCREEKSATHIANENRVENRVKGVKTSLNEEWSEPEITETEYPNNEVFETIGGHIVEYDSTAEKRRHRYQHPNSSFVEWQESEYVQRLTTDAYLIYDKEQYTLVGKNCRLTIKENGDFLVEGDVNAKINGDLNLSVVKNMNIDVGENYNLRVKGKMTELITKAKNVTVSAGNIVKKAINILLN